MTREEWLASGDPARMLGCFGERPREALWRPSPGGGREEIRPYPRVSDRQLRLFACACCRLFLARARDAWPGERADTEAACRAAEAWADGVKPSSFSAHTVLRQEAAGAAQDALRLACVSSEEKAALLREIVGDPCRAVGLFPAGAPRPRRVRVREVERGRELYRYVIPPWLTDEALALAGHAYASRDFSGLPVLADMLEEAGCLEEPLLRHLRGWERCPADCGGDVLSRPGGCALIDCCGWRPLRDPHVRGCRALDLLLGKE